MKERIYLASPHMGGEELKYVHEAFTSNWIAPLGPNVNHFEQELATYVGVNNACALSSGTAAIHLGLKALGITEGDIVFCSTLAFSASCNPIIYLGATPVFIDSNKDTWNMCPSSLALAFEEAVSLQKLPKVVIVVNLYGQSADLDPIIELCQKHEIMMGVITNGPSQHQWNKVKALKVMEFIPEEYIFVSGDIGVAKPQIGIFQHVEKIMNLNPEETLFIGDTFQSDIIGAKGAGWKAIWLNRRHAEHPLGNLKADYCIHDEAELYKLVLNFITNEAI